MRRFSLSLAVLGLALTWLVASPAGAATVSIVADKDNTLYESATGALSNGSGTRMFSGRTAQASDFLRRALVHFDVAGTIPAGSTINGASLTMEQVMTIAGPHDFSLHRASADWGEGASVAGGGQGAGGASAAGDATWIHTSFSSDFWASAGGDFDAAPSATTSVNGSGPYTWTSAATVSDVQAWLDDPGTNFGWVLVSDESVATITAKTFSTREASAGQPTLTIDFDPPGTDAGVPAVSQRGVVLIGLILLAIASLTLLRRARQA